MQSWSILKRLLICASRRRAFYDDRAASAVFVGALVLGLELGAIYLGWGRSSLEAARLFALFSFGAVAALLALLGIGVVAAPVATGIAGERDRKTIDALLASRFSNAQIVFGSVGYGFVRYLGTLAVTFPIVLLVTRVGGVDPRIVLLAYAALGSTAYAIAGIAIRSSIEGRSARRAMSQAILLITSWLVFPFFLVLLKPRFWPSCPAFLTTTLLWLLDSSPIGVFANTSGLVRRTPTPVDAVSRMIALQVAGGTALIAYSVVRLRAASRAVYDSEGRAFLRKLARLRWRKRPPCGDDPVLWYEKYSLRGINAFERLLGQGVALFLFGLVAFVTFLMARPAYQELRERGYGAARESSPFMDVYPIARHLVSRLNAAPPPGQARMEFNMVLRHGLALSGLFLVLVVSGYATEGIVVEREKDTWLGLIATPLSGREILRAKKFGVLWRVRAWFALVAVLLALALILGALHPLGLIAGLTVTAAYTWFCLAYGTYHSLVASNRAEASNRVLLPTLALAVSGLGLIFIPAGRGSVALAGVSPPMMIGLSLFSYEDVRDLGSHRAFPPLATMGVRTGEGPWPVVAVLILSVIVSAAVARYYSRLADRRFDAAVGRPTRV